MVLKKAAGVLFMNKFVMEKRCYWRICLYSSAVYARAAHQTLFPQISSLAEMKLRKRCSSVVVLLHGGGMYEENFSCGCLISGESHVFFSVEEMRFLFVTIISGEKCMFFYHSLYEKESN
jgi:hypothetical protein